jgi:hypothetical protein
MGNFVTPQVWEVCVTPLYREQAYSMWAQFSGEVFDRSSLGVVTPHIRDI